MAIKLAITDNRDDNELYKFLPIDSAAAVRVAIAAVSPELFPGQEVVQTYGEANSVGQSTDATIASYTVPAGESFFLLGVHSSGGNIADYRVEIDGSVVQKKISWWGDGFNVDFQFYNQKLSAGSIVNVIVNHSRPMVADFNATIVGVSKT